MLRHLLASSSFSDMHSHNPSKLLVHGAVHLTSEMQAALGGPVTSDAMLPVTKSRLVFCVKLALLLSLFSQYRKQSCRTACTSPYSWNAITATEQCAGHTLMPLMLLVLPYSLGNRCLSLPHSFEHTPTHPVTGPTHHA